MMSGPNSPNLNQLDYQVWGQYWNLEKVHQKPKAVPEFKNVL